MPLTTRRPRSTAPLRAFGALLCAVLCTLLTVLGTAAPASAHAVQTDSTPAEGSVVKSAPREVTVTFSEGISMSDGSLRVLGPDGKRVDKGKVRVVEGGKVTRGVGLKSGVRDGTYTVAWNGVSADSHPVAGAFTFSVGSPSQTTAEVPQEGEDSEVGAVDVLYQSGRYAAYTGFVLLVGGAAFVLTCWPRGATVRPLQRLVVTGWMTLTVTTLLLLLLRNSYGSSGELGDVFDLGGLRSVLGTKPGAALASRLLLLGTAAVIIAVLFGSYGKREEDSDEGRDLHLGLHLGGGVVALGLAATWSMSEHASTGRQAELAMPVDMVHLLAVAAWLGGLAALLTALHWGPPPARSAVRRFSQIAFGSVLVLTATGLYQSWRQVGTLSALTGTSFGQLLMLKVALVALMVAVASVSRRWAAQLGEARDGPAGAAQGETSVREAEPVPVGAGDGDGGPEPREGSGAASGSGPSSGSASGSASGSSSGSASGSASGAREAEDDDPGSAEKARTEDAEGTSDAAAAGGVRAAQLARQQAAVERSRRKKEREADPTRAALRRSVFAEAGIALVLLMVTTGLTNTQPGRTEERTRAADSAGESQNADDYVTAKKKISFDTGGDDGKGTAEVWVTPGQAGGNALRVSTTGPDGKPLDADEVLVALTLPAKNLGPVSVTFESINGDKSRWRSRVVQVPLAGKWKVAVTLRTSEIDQVTETTTVDIR